MFRDALLESAPGMRKRNAWPMATAFTLEMIAASVLVLVPLFSTGVLPLSTRVVMPIPPRYTPVEQHQAANTAASHSGVSMPALEVVPIANARPLLPCVSCPRTVDDNPQQPPAGALDIPGLGSRTGMDVPMLGRPIAPLPAQPKRPVVSHLDEGMLITKVVPEYPAMARLAGVQGDVKLHAVVGKDGAIQSLTVTSGPEMLRNAALAAVQQWRYRPYILNGQATEVETIITVSFHRF
jgi:periplasmic protein TonB